MSIRTPVFDLVSVALVGILLACAEERSLEPGPQGHTLYVSGQTYFTDSGRVDFFYFLDADSLTVFDSLPQLLTAGAASPEGRFLYIQKVGSGPDTTKKLDLQTKAGLWSSTDGTNVYVADAGRVLLRSARGSGCATLMQSVESGEIIQAIDGPCILGDASPNSKVIPVIASGDGTRPTWDSLVYLLDQHTGSTQWTVIPRDPSGNSFSLSQIVLHPDERRLLALGYHCGISGCAVVFIICDAHSGEVLLTSRMYGLSGDVAVSDDGRYAVVSDPSTPGAEDSPRIIDVFDLLTLERVKRFDLSSGLHRYAFGKLQFLPDDRRVIVGPSVGGPLQIIDLRTMTVGEQIWLPAYTPTPGVREPLPEVWTMFVGQRRY